MIDETLLRLEGEELSMGEIQELKTWQGDDFKMSLDSDAEFLIEDRACENRSIYLRDLAGAKEVAKLASVAIKHFGGKEEWQGKQVESVQEAKLSASERLTMALVSYLSEQRQWGWKHTHGGNRAPHLPDEVVTILRKEGIIP